MLLHCKLLVAVIDGLVDWIGFWICFELIDFPKLRFLHSVEWGGDLCEESAPLYYEYGCALLEHCIQTSDVLGPALRQNQSATQTTSEQSSGSMTTETEGADNAESTEETATPTMSGAEKKVNWIELNWYDVGVDVDVDVDVDVMIMPPTNWSWSICSRKQQQRMQVTPTFMPLTKQTIDIFVPITDDGDDLRLAFEVLECARVIYSKFEDPQHQVRHLSVIFSFPSLSSSRSLDAYLTQHDCYLMSWICFSTIPPVVVGQSAYSIGWYCIRIRAISARLPWIRTKSRNQTQILATWWSRFSCFISFFYFCCGWFDLILHDHYSWSLIIIHLRLVP